MAPDPPEERTSPVRRGIGFEESKEFLTEVTETMHRDHGEVPEMFSVYSVAKCFKDADILITL